MSKARVKSRRRRVAVARVEVDLTLIRWMARLTATQRLAALQDHVNLVSAVRRAPTSD